MSSADCQLRSTLTLKDTVTLHDIETAFRPFTEWADRPFQHYLEKDAVMYSIVDRQLLIDIEANVGLSGHDAIREIVANMHLYVAEPSYLLIYDYDTGDIESAITPLFIGATEEDRARAQVMYGLSQAAEWLTPVLGKDVMRQLEDTIRSLPVSPTDMRN